MAVGDEQKRHIAATLIGVGIAKKDVAKVVGVHFNTIGRWCKEDEFQAVCQKAAEDVIAGVIEAGQSATSLALAKIIELVSSENIEAIVLGMPLNMDGTRGGQAQIVSGFADKLKERLSIPIFFQDERLSTFAAEEKLAETKLTKKKRRGRIDAIAAAEILNAFLESGLRQNKGDNDSTGNL